MSNPMGPLSFPEDEQGAFPAQLDCMEEIETSCRKNLSGEENIKCDAKTAHFKAISCGDARYFGVTSDYCKNDPNYTTWIFEWHKDYPGPYPPHILNDPKYKHPQTAGKKK